MIEFLEQLCIFVGFTCVVVFLLNTLRRFCVWEKDLKKQFGGGWAVVTGGSDGIGLGFCQQLGKRSFNICVISRSMNKLKKTEQNLKKLNPHIDVKVVVADFSQSTEEGVFQHIIKELQGLDISILVNNVGTMVDIGEFSSNPPSEIKRQLQMNLMPMAVLTREILPKMLKRQKKSAILTLSSSAVYANLKGSANYCSTKHYNDFFSRSLEYQYGHKVDFLSVRPALVTTPLTRETKSFLHVNKNECAQGSLRSLGRVSSTSGHWWHEVQALPMEILSTQIIDFILGKIHKGIGTLYKTIDQNRKNNHQ